MQEVFKKIIKELRELKLKITAESRKVSETDNDCIFDKSDILDERAAGVADALKVVRRVLREYNNGWIPCSERLPESKKGVLVNYKNGDFAVDSMHEDGKWFWEDEEEGLVVIAWQPLPAPYKPKED